MDKLIQFIELCYHYCTRANNVADKCAHYNQAYGATAFYGMQGGNAEEEARQIWDEWQDKFLIAVYMGYVMEGTDK